MGSLRIPAIRAGILLTVLIVGLQYANPAIGTSMAESAEFDHSQHHGGAIVPVPEEVQFEVAEFDHSVHHGGATVPVPEAVETHPGGHRVSREGFVPDGAPWRVVLVFAVINLAVISAALIYRRWQAAPNRIHPRKGVGSVD